MTEEAALSPEQETFSRTCGHVLLDCIRENSQTDAEQFRKLCLWN